jgi:excisionase family DNA binding protein
LSYFKKVRKYDFGVRNPLVKYPKTGEYSSVTYQQGFSPAPRPEWPQEGNANMNRNVENESLLTPAEVAAMFRVDPKTVTRWAKAGKLTSIRTLGGHRRYRENEVKALLKSLPGNSSN